MLSKLKLVLFSFFNQTMKFVGGKGLGKVPGAWAVYHFLFKHLWPDTNIIEVEGNKMYVDLRDELLMRKTFAAYITTPHWNEMTTGIFKQVVKEGDVVLDLGANLGYYTLLAARLVGSKGKVYAFEPEPRNYRLLLKNIELNGFGNVVPLQKAVFDTTKRVKLSLSSEDSGAHTIRQPADTTEYSEFVEVESVKLDEFFANNNQPINVVKMDVEGSEPKAFTGMEKIIRENKDLKMFVEFYPSLIREAGHSPEEFARRLMEDYQFSVMITDDDWKDKRCLVVSSVAELMDYVEDKKIVNLFLERR